MRDAFIGLGTNLGERLDNLLRAAALCAQRCGPLTAASPVYATAPIGFSDQPEFWNAVVRLETAAAPRLLFDTLKRIERDMGRVASFPNGPRLIDLDILLLGDVVIADAPDLVIPHARMHERAFVLRPLADIAPSLRHPVLGLTVAELADSRVDQHVRRLQDASASLAALVLPAAGAARATDPA